MSNFVTQGNIDYLKEKMDDTYVAKVTGKELSSNDFTNSEKTKLAGINTANIPSNAEKAVVDALMIDVEELFPSASAIDLNDAAFIMTISDVYTKRFTLENAKPLMHTPNGTISNVFQMLCERVPSLESGGILTRQTFIYSVDGTVGVGGAYERFILYKQLAGTTIYGDWSSGINTITTAQIDTLFT